MTTVKSTKWQYQDLIVKRTSQKTDIQRASKASSAKGLLIYIFGKIAFVFINLIF